MDEAGTSSTLTFDAYGGVLTNTLPAEMQTALAGQGVLAEADTGLIHQGGGRFYDPALGRPLQPNAFGGLPTVPQSLNRYAATSLGAPGVAEGVSGGGNIYHRGAELLSLSKGAALDTIGQRSVRLNDLPYVGRLDITARGSKTALTKRLQREIAEFGGLLHVKQSALYESSAFLFVEGATEAEILAAAGRKINRVETILLGRYSPKGKPQITSVSFKVTSAPTLGLLNDLPAFALLKFGVGPAFDAGLGGYLQYLEDANNPYLTPGQKGLRAGVAGVGSGFTAYGVGVGLSSIGCAATVYCGIAAGIIGTSIWLGVQPFIFEATPFRPADRNLRPLSRP